MVAVPGALTSTWWIVDGPGEDGGEGGGVYDGGGLNGDGDAAQSTTARSCAASAVPGIDAGHVEADGGAVVGGVVDGGSVAGGGVVRGGGVVGGGVLGAVVGVAAGVAVAVAVGVAVALDVGEEATVGPVPKPIAGRGTKTAGSGVPLAVGPAEGDADGNTTLTGAFWITLRAPMPAAVNVPSGPLATSIFDWNFAPGWPAPETE